MRRLADTMDEIRQFVRIVTTHGGAGFVATQGPAYQTLCNPRLNLTQAVAASAHWQPKIARELWMENTEWTRPANQAH